jgi:hypothetical protein
MACSASSTQNNNYRGRVYVKQHQQPNWSRSIDKSISQETNSYDALETQPRAKCKSHASILDISNILITNPSNSRNFLESAEESALGTGFPSGINEARIPTV